MAKNPLRPTHPSFIDMTGKQVGYLKVLRRAPNVPKRGFNGGSGWGNARWLCRCICGNRVVKPGIDLRFKRTKYLTCCSKQCERAYTRIEDR
jgi:hypothetical protein